MKTNILLNKLIIVGLIIFFLFAGFVVYSFFHEDTAKVEAVKISEEENVDVNKQVEEGKINVQYQLYNEFDGKESVNFLLRNIKNNHYPIKFKIYDESNRKIYESAQVDLGYEVKKIILDKRLSPGEHKCNIEIAYICEGNVTSKFPLKINVI